MSIGDIVNHPQWELVEVVIKKEMDRVLLDMPDDGTNEKVALHALANKKAYNMLKAFLAEVGLHKVSDKEEVKPRNYE